MRGLVFLVSLVGSAILVHSAALDISERAAAADAQPVDTYNGVKDKFKDAFLKCHNDLRKRHGVPNLTWDADLASAAQTWAVKILKEGTNEHDNSIKNIAGENLAGKGYSFDAVATPAVACANWYSELWTEGFQYGGGEQRAAGHFTQVVWKSTTKVGCGCAYGKDTDNYHSTQFVCRYTPGANPENDDAAHNANVLQDDGSAPTQPDAASLELDCFDHGSGCNYQPFCANYAWYREPCPALCGNCS